MALPKLTVSIAHGSFQSAHKLCVGVASRRHCPNFFELIFKAGDVYDGRSCGI
ncbi:MAG: hypothetical protein V7L20_10825 [Nostoc sp.]